MNTDILRFAEESKSPVHEKKTHFKLLIVDDEKQIHVMTKLVLADYVYKGMGLEFLSAFSGQEAKAVIKKTPDIACCLLDVVMETRDTGLEVARFIREDEKNTKKALKKEKNTINQLNIIYNLKLKGSSKKANKNLEKLKLDKANLSKIENEIVQNIITNSI